MFLSRSAAAVARRAAVAPVVRRSFATSMARHSAPKSGPPSDPNGPVNEQGLRISNKLADVKNVDDLFGPGAKQGTVPTDIEQSTGLERLEILGKMEGVDIFDMKPLDASRLGTMKDPIMVRSAGEEQYAGCTGFPADSHNVLWLGLSRERPVERCPECGSVYKMNYVGPEDDGHGHHDHHGAEDVKSFADYVKPQYW